MRWDELFADLGAQLSAAEVAELAAEVADRTRREVGSLRMVDRLRPAVGARLVVNATGLGTARGTLLDAGTDWLLLHEDGAAELLLPSASVLSLTGVGGTAEVPSSEGSSVGEVARRLDLRWALRGLARSRSGVQLVLRDGSTVSGTLDRVGADHIDVAEHAPGEARRAAAVRQVRLVPLTGVGAVRSWV